MANVCVITGGGSGMGLEAAKYMPKDKIIVISGRTLSKLEGAVAELKALGYEAYAKACDTSRRESVQELAEYAASLGEIKNVINSAGVSPAMDGTPEGILRINALGTVYVNQEFSKRMQAGSVIVDVASNSAYVLPSFIINKKIYPLAETDESAFLKKLVKKSFNAGTLIFFIRHFCSCKISKCLRLASIIVRRIFLCKNICKSSSVHSDKAVCRDCCKLSA